MEHSRSKIQLISIVPNLVGGEGHTTPYHQAVSQAVQPLGWQHQVLIPRDSNYPNLLPNWLPCLYPYDLESEGNVLPKLLKIYHAFRLGINIADQIKDNDLEQSQLTILFLERFIHLQLFALCLAVWLLPQKNLAVWLLYRRDTHQGKTRWLYKILNQLIQTKLPKSHFQLLTDSQLLSQSLSSYFQKSVQVVPIPHTDFKFDNANSSVKQEIVWCWWPGSPRLEKGWEMIKTLSQTSFTKRDYLGLMAARNSNLMQFSEGILIKLLPNQLSREEYDQWLNYCDMVLLPYDSVAYQERTSGIFTEAIIAGKIPLVTPNSWMAYELRDYQLEQDLVLNWEQPEEVLNSVLAIAVNPHIKEKLKVMQTAYQKFHNIDNYGKCFNELYQKSII